MGPAPEALVALTLIGPRHVHTLPPCPTDVLLRTLVHIFTSEPPTMHQELVAMVTTAPVRALGVDADSSAEAARLPVTLVIIHTGVPLGVEPVAGVAVAVVAALSVDTVAMATDVPVEPALVCDG